jgi:hypothetical protein
MATKPRCSIRRPHLNKRVESANVSNVHKREIGAGWLNLRGAQTVTGLESIGATGIAIDEYDLIPKQVIPVAEAVPLGEECDEASS